MLSVLIAVGARAEVCGGQAPSPAEPDTFPVPRLFRSTSPLAVTLTANFKQVRNDRSENSPYHAATITYTDSGGKPVTVPLRVKTHGIWRLKHCEFPPLRLNFSDKTTKHTLFHGLGRPKFVNTCRDQDRYEQLVLQEYQLYRIFQLLTPQSHRARLVKMSYADSATGKVDATRYGFLFEDPDQLATRLGGQLVRIKGAGPDDIDHRLGALVYAFEYLIGNTDFSFNGLHNGELVQRPDGSPVIPIAYDFDFAGAVNAPYATVDPKLPMRTVRERLFRGYCAFDDEYEGAFAAIRAKKDAINALYTDEVGRLLEQRTARDALAYFAEYFEDTATFENVKRNVLGSCVKTQ